MRIKFIEQMRFRFAGRAVPVIKVEDVDEAGKVTTIHLLGTCKRRANSILSTWDSKGWEIDPAWGPVRLIDEKGIESQAYVVSESGKTVPLMTKWSAFPNREDIIGRAATMDDIADSMDLGKSVKNMAIGVFIGMGLYAVFVGPMLTAVMS